MKNDTVRPEDLLWQCDRCRCDVVAGPVALAYMNNRFTTDLAYCPTCKTVLITEALAMGKMAEVEKVLEDK